MKTIGPGLRPQTSFNAVLGGSLPGIWRFSSTTAEVRATAGGADATGPARGLLALSEDDRMIIYVDPEQRALPETDAETERSLRRMFAIAARFRLEGTLWIIESDVQGRLFKTDIDQIRLFWIDDEDRLHVASQWYASPLCDGRFTRSHMIWERASTAVAAGES